MSQSFAPPLVTDNLPEGRTKIEDSLEALRTRHSGLTEPSSTVAHMLWADTTTGLLKQRSTDNTEWFIIGTLNAHEDHTNTVPFSFTLAAASYVTAVEGPFVRMPANATILDVKLIPSKSSVGSTGGKHWTSKVRNATQGVDLVSVPWNSNTSELTALVATDLGIDQNQDVDDGDIISFTVQSVGTSPSPTNMQHQVWAYSVHWRRR